MQYVQLVAEDLATFLQRITDHQDIRQLNIAVDGGLKVKVNEDPWTVPLGTIKGEADIDQYVPRHDQSEIGAAVEQAKKEILADIETGIIPRWVRSFRTLHDFVDANDYAGFTTDRSHWGVPDINQVTEKVDIWLRTGRGGP